MHTDMALDRPLLKEYPFTCPGISHSLDREWDKPGWKRSYGVRFQLGKEEKKRIYSPPLQVQGKRTKNGSVLFSGTV